MEKDKDTGYIFCTSLSFLKIQNSLSSLIPYSSFIHPLIPYSLGKNILNFGWTIPLAQGYNS